MNAVLRYSGVLFLLITVACKKDKEQEPAVELKPPPIVEAKPTTILVWPRLQSAYQFKLQYNGDRLDTITRSEYDLASTRIYGNDGRLVSVRRLGGGTSSLYKYNGSRLETVEETAGNPPNNGMTVVVTYYYKEDLIDSISRRSLHINNGYLHLGNAKMRYDDRKNLVEIKSYLDGDRMAHPIHVVQMDYEQKWNPLKTFKHNFSDFYASYFCGEDYYSPSTYSRYPSYADSPDRLKAVRVYTYGLQGNLLNMTTHSYAFVTGQDGRLLNILKNNGVFLAFQYED